jgi:BirA family biotin operon repressor/biotin-[acetyl-CoA-carboxylase] ligase
VLSALGPSLPRRSSAGDANSAPLSREAIVAALAGRRRLAVEVAGSVDSTSSELLRRAPATDIHRRVLLAERQTAGRGRRGRGWTSTPGGSLTFSLGWRFARAPSELSTLPLVVGLAVCRALEGDGFAGVELKWPNDLVHRGAKLAGVLVELAGDGPGRALAVIGIGVNVRLPAPVRRAIGQPVTDLASVAPRAGVDRNALAARIVGELAGALQAYARSGFSRFRAEWLRRHTLQGKPVEVLLPDGGKVRGTACGIDAEGSLLVASEGRSLRFVSGEVSLRPS